MKLHVAAAAFAAVLAVPTQAHAHQPFFARGTEGSSESAFVLPDADVSRVVYVDAPCPAEPFWARIDATSGDVVSISLGVPVLDELRDYRPTVYLVGPDVEGPLVRVPWSLPEAYRAIELRTDQVADPRVFHEPFTGTDSWILLERRHVVERQGASYYVVVDPPAAAGRYWLSSGTEEVPGGDPTALARIGPFFDAKAAAGLGRACERGPITPAGSGFTCAIDPTATPRSAPLAALGLLLAIRRRSRIRARAARRSSPPPGPVHARP
jgi:hypothetical protein